MLPSALMRAEGRFRAALRPMGKPTYDPRARLVSRPLERIDGRNTDAYSPAGAPYRAVLVGWFHKIGGPVQAAAGAAITRPPPASRSHACDAEAEPLNLSDVVRQPCTFNVAASQDRVDGTVTGVAPFGSAVSDAWSAISSAMPEPPPPFPTSPRCASC